MWIDQIRDRPISALFRKDFSMTKVFHRKVRGLMVFLNKEIQCENYLVICGHPGT